MFCQLINYEMQNDVEFKLQKCKVQYNQSQLHYYFTQGVQWISYKRQFAFFHLFSFQFRGCWVNDEHSQWLITSFIGNVHFLHDASALYNLSLAFDWLFTKLTYHWFLIKNHIKRKTWIDQKSLDFRPFQTCISYQLM